MILTQTGLPDPLEQVLHQKPVFDGRLLVREFQGGWELKAELVSLSACETAARAAMPAVRSLLVLHRRS